MPNVPQAVVHASRGAMEATINALLQHLRSSEWLAQTNRYAIDTVIRIKADLTNPPSVIEPDLTQYIAASAPLHLLDGWTFLGRAVDATLRGDADTARHLAYYAELRAAMSLLATEGLGVFDKQHFVVEPPSSATLITGARSTHQIVWDLLDEWCKLPKSASLIAEIVTIGGVPLSLWLQRFQPAAGNALQPIAANWLRAWGLDIQRLRDDRDARNEASYRPTALRQSARVKARECIDTVRDLWRLFEPTGKAEFEIVDTYLLRMCLESIFSSLRGNTTTTTARRRYRREIDRMISGINSNNEPTTLRKFLLRTQKRIDPPVMILARRTDDVSAPNHHLQVLSRAALLLRISTGACALLLQRGGASFSQMRFWWSEVGATRGCWDKPSRAPTDVTDLWADIQSALEEIERKQKDFGAKASLWRWRQGSLGEVALLGECERIGLWGLNV
jgi:hypothetical protein